MIPQSLDEDLRRKQESLLVITDKIHPITAVLSPDDSSTLRDLIFQIDNHTKLLLQLENSLQIIGLDLKEHDQDKTKVQDNIQAQESGRFHGNGGKLPGNGRVGESAKSSEFDDDDGNYADIDALRNQILNSRSKVPVPSLISRQTLGQASNGSGRSNGATNGPVGQRRPAASPSGSAFAPALYERVEEVLPSPMADYDLVSVVINT